MDEMLTLEALAADPDVYHLIDVRDAADYANAHVAGAVVIPLVTLEARAGERPPGKIPVTICGKGGGRSAECCALATDRLSRGPMAGRRNKRLARASRLKQRTELGGRQP